MAEKKRADFRGANIVLMIVSAVMAILLWVVLSLTAFPDAIVTLRGVPVDFSLDNSYAEVSGLSIISADIDQVNVRFSGLRYQIGDYKNEDVRVSMVLDSVRASGSYEIPLIATSLKGDQLNNIEIFPQSIHVEFDRIATKTFSVSDNTLTADLSSVVAAMGYVFDPAEVEIIPSSVTISGPQDYIEQVTSCVIGCDTSLNLKETVTIDSNKTTLYNGNSVFENPKVTLDTEDFRIYIPVYITRTIPLDVTLMGYTDNIDLDSIPYTLSTYNIRVRSQNSAVENIESINLGYIDIREVEPGRMFTYSINRNSNYTNISGIDSVEVRFDLEGYSTKSITISNTQIYTINNPSDYSVAVEQERLRVTVVGPADILEELDASSLVAEIDLMDYGTDIGQRMLTAAVFAPNHPNVWVYGTPQVLASFNPIVTQADAGADENADVNADGAN